MNIKYAAHTAEYETSPPLWFNTGSDSAHTSLHTVKLKYAAEEETVFFPEGKFECLENVMTVKQPFEITEPKRSDKELWLFMLQVQTWSLPRQLHHTDTQRPTHSTLPLHPELLGPPQKQELGHQLPFSPPHIVTLKPLATASWHWRCWCCTIPMSERSSDENHSPFPWHTETHI